MINALLQPLAYGFMQRGMIAAILVGIVCSVIGCYIVLRSMAFLGDALAHSILPGVAIAYLLGINLLVGALTTAILVGIGISFLSRRGQIKEDTAIGIIFSAALALGVALISSIRSYAVDLSHILFGNLLGVSVTDLWLIGILALVVIIAIILLYRPSWSSPSIPSWQPRSACQPNCCAPFYSS
jgi:ABC-type Mn2+/Zn2+ transport system permease subunit